ncbi:MAG: GNAT family N-acetyltransferase [Myxococcota bacterium]
MAESRIRRATPEDAAAIVRLVRALAVYEKEPVENVKLREDEVVRDGFGATPRFEVLIAELDQEPVGFALFFPNYSTWEGSPGLYVEDVFVEERARGLGLGRRLMAEIAGIARQRGCPRVELSVLDWNPAREFYQRIGFRQQTDWLSFRLSGSALAALSKDAEAPAS